MQEGRLDRLRMAMRHGFRFDYSDCLSAAALNTNLDVLHWILELEVDPNWLWCPFPAPARMGTRDGAMRLAMAGAAQSGRLQAMRLIYAQCPELSRDDAEAAGRGEHLEALQWMHAHGLVLDAGICADAAYSGALAALQWLHQVGCPWDQRTCAAAAGRGDLPLLEWLRDPERAPPCPWDSESSCPGAPRESEACQRAAVHGHTKVLQWLRSAHHPTPCPWDDDLVTHTLLDHARRGLELSHPFDFAVLGWMRGQVESPNALFWLNTLGGRYEERYEEASRGYGE